MWDRPLASQNLSGKACVKMMNKNFERTVFQQEKGLKIKWYPVEIIQKIQDPMANTGVFCQHSGTSNELAVTEHHHGHRILLRVWHCVLWVSFTGKWDGLGLCLFLEGRAARCQGCSCSLLPRAALLSPAGSPPLILIDPAILWSWKALADNSG